MIFKKVGSKIFGVELNAKEQEALGREIQRQVAESTRKNEVETDSSILWMLHVHFGFGPKRLRRAWELFYEQARALEKHYEMPDGDGGWICQRELRNYGCDVEAWYREWEERQK